MNRRNFVKTAGGAVAFPYIAARTVLGANDRINVGFVGVGGRAQWLIQHEDFAPARIVAVTDCWLPRCEEAAKLHPDGGKWTKALLSVTH